MDDLIDASVILKIGGYIALDSMKHELNKLHWSLIVTSLKRYYETICVACKAIFVSKCHDAYAFVVNEMLKIAPKTKREDFFIISADGIMNKRFFSTVSNSWTQIL